VLESPLSHGRIILQGWMGAALAGELAMARSFPTLCNLFKEIPPQTIALFLGLLLGSGFLCEAKPEEPYPGESRSLLQWDFHDLLFHARSRLGRHTNRFGGTYRFQDKIDPLPAVKPPMSEEGIDLFRPDMERLEERDYPFSLVLEQRRSIREYADFPITDRELGEFLYRTARVKELIRTESQDLSKRPYPGGGAIYELELYLTIDSCNNIPAGLYHYCPKSHRLEKLCGRTEATNELLKDAMRSTGEGTPQVLITIAARFQRLSWKYESMAYSVILKNVGVLYQTMYLVATAMDLAPCALGGGDSDLFAKAAGLDYYLETSVGEFLLGSKRM
jgi:SagB-type dehydrogenase family enzyme